MGKKLIFVYNANSDFFSVIKDNVTKIVAPSKYTCNLCMITHGNFGVKKKWSEFISTLKIKSEFLHKDEFLKKYKDAKTNFPCVFIQESNKLKLIIDNKKMNSFKTMDELIDSISNAIK